MVEDLSTEVISGICEDYFYQKKDLEKEIKPKKTSYDIIVACKHFGNNKDYFWKVPNKITNDIREGSLLEVENANKNENVVKVTYILDYDEYKREGLTSKENLKKVISVLRK